VCVHAFVRVLALQTANTSAPVAERLSWTQLEASVNEALRGVRDEVRRCMRARVSISRGGIDQRPVYVSSVQAGILAGEALNESNNIVAMAAAGSKGGMLNISQIIACVGQQEVQGKVRDLCLCRAACASHREA
jgi:hypothetical protein